MDNQTQTLGLAKMIYEVKNELLHNQVQELETSPIFSVSEITVEVNFTVGSDVHGGVDFKIVQIGSKIEEQRVHKAIITLTPILSKEDLLSELLRANPDALEELVSNSTKAVFKGSIESPSAPSRT